MRKALIGLILAATVPTPAVASAQGREGRNRHEQRERPGARRGRQ